MLFLLSIVWFELIEDIWIMYPCGEMTESNLRQTVTPDPEVLPSGGAEPHSGLGLDRQGPDPSTG